MANLRHCFHGLVNSTLSKLTKSSSTTGTSHFHSWINQPTKFQTFHCLNTSYQNFGGVLSNGHKTSSTASKRFIKMGSGVMKYGHAGKKHLNSSKNRVRLNRLSRTGILTGVWLKKMKKLL